MCGICGIQSDRPIPLAARLSGMNEAQRHRGPDGGGYYVERDEPLLVYGDCLDPGAAGVFGLAHRRLAILDPAGGRQPMASADGSLVAVLNGEIYNFERLRREEAAGYPFSTDTDTEVLLSLYRREPDRPERWLNLLEGVFALAIWDRRRRRLLLARDRFGVKPLHIACRRQSVLFSSEIKSLLAAGVPARLNRAALHAFMNVRYVPGLQTLFSGIERFPPAHYAWVAGGVIRTPRPYYSLPSTKFTGPRGELRERIRDTFYRAVSDQMLSDVPVGFSLSGGLDSSMNVAAGRAALAGSTQPRAGDSRLRTFTLGFGDPSDECGAARLVADKFGAVHTEEVLDANPLAALAEVIRAVEEPKINILQGYLLGRVVSGRVKVLLSGLGGDELFAGYDIHRFCNTLGRGHSLVPDWLRRGLLSPLGRLWWRAQNRSEALRFEHYRIGGQIALSLGDRSQFYARLRNAWDYDPEMYGRIYGRPAEFRELPAVDTHFRPFFGPEGDYLEQVLRAEFQTKMVNDFLVNEDRTTSAHGIEGRVPFLDRALVELAFSIPAREKMRGGETKKLWKDSVGSALPAAILDRPKQGFSFSSYHQWKKDLRTALIESRMVEWCGDTGLFNPRFIGGLLDYPAHPNLRWHYFMAWMMLGVKTWTEVFKVGGIR